MIQGVLPHQQVLLVGAGVGVTPFLSMLADAIEQHAQRSADAAAHPYCSGGAFCGPACARSRRRARVQKVHFHWLVREPTVPRCGAQQPDPKTALPVARVVACTTGREMSLSKQRPAATAASIRQCDPKPCGHQGPPGTRSRHPLLAQVAAADAADGGRGGRLPPAGHQRAPDQGAQPLAVAGQPQQGVAA